MVYDPFPRNLPPYINICFHLFMRETILRQGETRERRVFLPQASRGEGVENRRRPRSGHSRETGREETTAAVLTEGVGAVKLSFARF
jgi:hypothetical protein